MESGRQCSDTSEATIGRQTETYPLDVDWKETIEAHIFSMDLPGLNKNEVSVGLEEEERVLEIVGERKREKDEEQDKWHVMERRFGKFIRRFPMPENAKVDEIVVSMSNCVLTVTVPKKLVTEPRVKYFAINDGSRGGPTHSNSIPTIGTPGSWRRSLGAKTSY